MWTGLRNGRDPFLSGFGGTNRPIHPPVIIDGLFCFPVEKSSVLRTVFSNIIEQKGGYVKRKGCFRRAGLTKQGVKVLRISRSFCQCGSITSKFSQLKGVFSSGSYG